MAGLGNLVLRPWIRELILGSETLSSPRAGQLLKVLQDAETPGPSHAPVAPDAGAMLLVSDGTHSVRCLVTREALDTSDWSAGSASRSPRAARLQSSTSKWTGSACCPLSSLGYWLLVATRTWMCRKSCMTALSLTLSQLLDEVQEDQQHRGALVHLAESCLVLTGPCTAPPLTHWAASRCRAMGEAVYSVPSLLLHIPENDQQILSSLGSSQKVQGTPALTCHMPLEESSASISLLPALPLAAPDLVQKHSSQSLPAICSASGSPPFSSPHPSHTSNSPLLSCTPSLSPFDHNPSPYQAHVTRAHKLSLEFRELGLPHKNQQSFPRTGAKGVQEPCPVWDPPKRHRDGSTFQYEYELPCASLCAQVHAVRLPPQLVAWALHFLMEPPPESELTQV
ncbi:adrenocortical dysplasia protein homolog isoform X2 [Marmota monax]|uniref:adrenocortical dysplasia protein homolog isoform X2 n=1 Tax=Marmota monax TaxID=9995 RepID=UPI001EB05E94|nr:adrenocortical dysplasia protein homolog isoform X2 [Marmota monax]